MRDIPIQDMTIERLRAELQAEYNRQAVVDTLNKQLQTENKKLRSCIGQEFSPADCLVLFQDTKQLQTKNERLKEQLIQAASQHYCKTCGEILDGYKRDETYAENDRLKENLRIYGKHKTGCPYHGISLLCDCGFKKIMEDSKLLKGIDYDR
jgi:hypothetical protein